MSAADLGPEFQEGAGSAELLTEGADGRAVEGPRYPGTHAVVVYEDPVEVPVGPPYAESCEAESHLAHLHTFFKRDRLGRAVPGTWCNFFVPDRLLADGWPTDRALRLVAERMGWDG